MSFLRLTPFLWALILGLLPASPAAAQDEQAATAIFAGGNFWSLQYVFDHTAGVVSTLAGYTGGRIPNPTYRQVAGGGSGHRMAVLVTYDPARLPYERLLNVFWHSIDPLDSEGQFCDRGSAFSSAIYFSTPHQLQIAADSRMLLDADSQRMGGGAIVTPIEKAGAFYAAEAYHQAYYRRNPLRFRFYERTCGRAQHLQELWGAN